MEEKRQDALEMEKETDKRSQKTGKEIKRKSNINKKSERNFGVHLKK